MTTFEGPKNNEQRTETVPSAESHNPLESATIGGEQHKASDYLEQHRKETGMSMRTDSPAPSSEIRLDQKADQASDKVMRSDTLQTAGGGALPEKGPAKMEDDSKKKPREEKPVEKTPEEKKPQEKRIEPHDSKPPEVRGQAGENAAPDSGERLREKPGIKEDKKDKGEIRAEPDFPKNGGGGPPGEAALEKKISDLKERKAEFQGQVNELDQRVADVKTMVDKHDDDDSKRDWHRATQGAIEARKDLQSTKVELLETELKLEALRKQHKET